jgi:SAM-dependent methyltransferase
MKNILQEKPKTELTGRLRFSVEFVDIKDIANKDILDIGCGFGWCELDFIKKGCRSIKGIEIAGVDLEAAKENVHDPKASFDIGSAIDIPYAPKSFDTVVSWEVIEHIPKNTELAMFKEIHRVLRPGGSFYLSTPHRHLLSNVMDPAWWLIGHRHYSKQQLKEFGLKTNLKLTKVEIKGKLWALSALLNMYISKWVFRRPQFFKEFFSQKDDAEYTKNKKGFANIFVKFTKI